MAVREVDRPDPGPRDVLVRPEAIGLCGTDFHIYSGAANYHRDAGGAPIPLERAPQILGHEITGVIEHVGGDVTDLEAGQRVVLDQGLNCISCAREELCEYCETGDSHQCEEFLEHGISGLPGGLAEAISVPAVNAVRIRSELPPERAALTEPLACVLHSADVLARTDARYLIDTSETRRRVRSVLVCGAGPAGLLWVQVLRRVLGFQGRVFVSEPDAEKRALAENFGAETIDPGTAGVVAEVAERTEGRRVELLIDASGSGPLFRDVPGLVRKQATIMLYGHGHAGVGMELLNPVQWAEPTLLSPVGASSGFDEDGRPTVYRRALRMLEDGVIDVEALVTHRYVGLEAVPEAFERGHRESGYVKGVALLG